MNLLKLLATAGVPETLHAQATDCLRDADKASNGLTWAKWKVRLFKAGKIAGHELRAPLTWSVLPGRG